MVFCLRLYDLSLEGVGGTCKRLGCIVFIYFCLEGVPQVNCRSPDLSGQVSLQLCYRVLGSFHPVDAWWARRLGY